MSISELKTFKDIQDAIIRRAKLDDNAARRTDIKEKINTAEQQIIFEDKYRWAAETRPIRLKAKYTTGTISITQDTDDVTGDALSHTHWRMKLGSSNNPFKVNRVGSSTAITLDAQYAGSDLSGESYTMYKDEYGLFPNFGEIRSIKIPGITRPINIIGPEEMDNYRLHQPFLGGLPRYVTVHGKHIYNNKTWANFNINTDFWEDSYDSDKPNNDRLIIWPAIFNTDTIAHIRYTAIPRPMSNDADEPTIPYKNRYILVLRPLIEHFAQSRDRNTRSMWKEEYKDLKSKMAADIDAASDELIFRQDMRRFRRNRWAWRSDYTDQNE